MAALAAHERVHGRELNIRPEDSTPTSLRERLATIADRGLLPSKMQLPMTTSREGLVNSIPLVGGAIATVLTFVVAYVGYVLFENRFPDGFFEIWRRWDTIHYLSIAMDGYGTDADHRILIIWPPLYPWLIRSCRPIAGGYLGAGLFVAFVGYLAAVVGLYRLVALDFPERVARRAVIYLTIFPTAYFLHAAYTESTYIALIVGSFL